ncbi:MAG: hypothetical protein AAF821_17690 [Cyanobacteria bacterium P01_D01_bin.156]
MSVDVDEVPASPWRSRPVIKRVEPPQLIQELEPWLENYAPQINILQPLADQVIEDTSIRVELAVGNLPIYKDDAWGLGPHVELLLDNQPYGAIYDLDQPIVLEGLTPGTHTLRALAVRPWNESFKNLGSYAQVTFHSFAKTDENAPAVEEPLLTYVAPGEVYGAEPVLLDFYLTDAPLHEVAATDASIQDWRVRYTINGESLLLDTWEPIYIEGLKPGRNWVQLTLVDPEGNPIEGVFNNTVRLIEYDATQQDSLAQIILGKPGLEMVGSIVDPSYEPPVQEVPESSVVEDAMAVESADDDELISNPDMDDLDIQGIPGGVDAKAHSLESDEDDSEVVQLETSILDSQIDTVLLEKSETKPLASDELAPNSAADTRSVANNNDDDSVDIFSADQGLEMAPETIELDTEFQANRESAPELSEETVAKEELKPEDSSIPVPELTPDSSEAPIVNDDSSNATDADKTASRRYFKELYDYRERSMSRRQ